MVFKNLLKYVPEATDAQLRHKLFSERPALAAFFGVLQPPTVPPRYLMQCFNASSRNCKDDDFADGCLGVLLIAVDMEKKYGQRKLMKQITAKKGDAVDDMNERISKYICEEGRINRRHRDRMFYVEPQPVPLEPWTPELEALLEERSGTDFESGAWKQLAEATTQEEQESDDEDNEGILQPATVA